MNKWYITLIFGILLMTGSIGAYFIFSPDPEQPDDAYVPSAETGAGDTEISSLPAVRPDNTIKPVLAADFKRVCKNNTIYWNQTVPVYTSELINWPNGTKEDRKTFVKDTYELRSKQETICKETVGINGKDVDFSLQGYNCKNTTGEVICDSCIDGNCDGTCSPNGGETCCKVSKNAVVCKNGVGTWKERSSAIPVNKLEVR